MEDRRNLLGEYYKRLEIGPEEIRPHKSRWSPEDSDENRGIGPQRRRGDALGGGKPPKEERRKSPEEKDFDYKRTVA